jgi:5-methylcytosine-specific restriction protein A
MPGRIPTRNPNPHYNPTRAYEASPQRHEDRAFYNAPAWRNLRRAHITANPLCFDCEAKGITTLAQQVHHVVPRDADPGRGLDPANLESTCVRCHNAKGKGKR